MANASMVSVLRCVGYTPTVLYHRTRPQGLSPYMVCKGQVGRLGSFRHSTIPKRRANGSSPKL